MTEESPLHKYRTEILLAGILLLSGFLNLWNLWNQGYSNSYYAAAVRSMLENPPMLIFNSFDAGGFVTVDKPPLGLWVQAASAVLFGFSGWALVLPQALAGVGSVALVYCIVSRPFGKPAGLVGAFALAVTPIFVAVSRNGTMDGLLIFLLLLAIWVALKAARENSLPLLIVAAVLIGLGFNIKMIQAFIAVPAILAIYLLGAREIPAKKRLIHLGLALAVLAAVSLSWAVAVDMVPADQRPYIGGSGDNTVMGLIVNYNGLHRLENGMQSPGGAAPPGNAGVMNPGQNDAGAPPAFMENRTVDRNGNRFAPGEGTVPEQGLSFPSASQSPGSPTGITGSPPGRSGGGMMDETGSPGFLRLFGQGLAGQISWLLPFVLIGLLACMRRPASLSLQGLEEAGYFSERGITLLALCLWLFPGLLYFSFTTGFWHTYYLATIAPPLAAIAGIGTVALSDAYREGGWTSGILIGAVLITGLVQIMILRYTPEWSGVLVPVLACGIPGIVLILAVINRKEGTGSAQFPKIMVAVAVGLLFIAPFVWSCTPLVYGSGNFLPVAGPSLAKSGGTEPGGNAGPGMGETSSGLTEYLISHHAGEQWIVAVSSSMEAANIILNTGEPVMALGGFSGTDQVLTTDSLKHLIDQGKIRYFYTSGSSADRGGTSGNAAITSWVSSTCAVVSSTEYGGAVSPGITPDGDGLDTSASEMSLMMPADITGNSLPGAGRMGGNVLYDCRGTITSATAAAGS
jgi:4-amino-4-deoxy-L-arabinose transferase-like glycosyltransferase